jgi:hypothetical protein
VGVLALVFALLTFEDQPAQDRSAPWGFVALALAGCGCAAAFFGAAQPQAGGPPGPRSLVPLLAGVMMIVALVVHQYRSKRPLMPVKQLATTFPAGALLIAMCASSAAFGLMELVLTALQAKSSPAHTALLFLPEFGAAIVTAVPGRRPPGPPRPSHRSWSRGPQVLPSAAETSASAEPESSSMARSPRLTMPTARPCCTTGSRRTALPRISWIA